MFILKINVIRILFKKKNYLRIIFVFIMGGKDMD